MSYFDEWEHRKQESRVPHLTCERGSTVLERYYPVSYYWAFSRFPPYTSPPALSQVPIYCSVDRQKAAKRYSIDREEQCVFIMNRHVTKSIYSFLTLNAQFNLNFRSLWTLQATSQPILQITCCRVLLTSFAITRHLVPSYSKPMRERQLEKG